MEQIRILSVLPLEQRHKDYLEKHPELKGEQTDE